MMEEDHPHAQLYYLFGTANHPQGSSWLERLPPGLFAIFVGLFGLTGAWQRAGAYGWELAGIIGNLMLWPVTAGWIVSLLLYAIKCKLHPQAVLREFRHPVQGSLQALLPLSLSKSCIVATGHSG